PAGGGLVEAARVSISGPGCASAFDQVAWFPCLALPRTPLHIAASRTTRTADNSGSSSCSLTADSGHTGPPPGHGSFAPPSPVALFVASLPRRSSHSGGLCGSRLGVFAAWTEDVRSRLLTSALRQAEHLTGNLARLTSHPAASRSGSIVQLAGQLPDKLDVLETGGAAGGDYEGRTDCRLTRLEAPRQRMTETSADEVGSEVYGTKRGPITFSV
ncbi:unnamed protein product, partial [Protopolystoma xenopodis]